MLMPLLLAFALSTQIESPIFRVSSSRPCTIASAERVTFEQVHREAGRLRHRCIAVRGIWSGRALYQGEAAARAAGSTSEATIRQRIGLSGNADVERGSDRPDAWIVVGLLYDCSAFAGQRPVDGYCHSNRTGPFVAVTDLRRRSWPGPRGIW
jgi:hypothetical protein